MTLDLVDGRTLKVEIPKEDLVAIRNKEDVFEQFFYGTSIFVRDSTTSFNNKILYYDCSVDEIPLEDYRLQERTVEEDSRVKEYIIGGLLATLYLVADGKIYDVELNPLNFVYDQRKKKVKAFYRKSHALGEITDKWLYDVKKLIAFYLVNDSGLMPERFEKLVIEDIEKYMSEPTLKGFKRLKNARSIGEMAEMLLSEKRMIPLKSYPQIFARYQKPKDITTELGFHPVVSDVKSKEAQKMIKEERVQETKKEASREVRKGKEDVEKKGYGVGTVLIAAIIGLICGLVIDHFWLSGNSGLIYNYYAVGRWVEGWWV